MTFKSTRKGGEAEAQKIRLELEKRASELGWKVDNRYVAHSGSVYLTLWHEENDWLCKVRIADHNEHSENHVACEIEITSSLDEIDWVDLLAAIQEGQQGEF